MGRWSKQFRACAVGSLATAAALVAGCQRETVASGPQVPLGRPVVIVNGQPASPDGTPLQPPTAAATPSVDRTLKSDPCAARLHEISGAMLAYHAVYGRMPRAIEELKTIQGPADATLEFTCPASGEAYVYVPSGLRLPGEARQVVVHDRSPGPAGLRWVILMQPPRGRQTAATLVTRLTEPEFRAYTAAEPQPASTRPVRTER